MAAAQIRIAVQDDVAGFGPALKKHRDISGLTLREVAQHLGVSHASVKGWENGIRLPSPGNVAKLEELFGIRDYALHAAAEYLPAGSKVMVNGEFVADLDPNNENGPQVSIVTTMLGLGAFLVLIPLATWLSHNPRSGDDEADAWTVTLEDGSEWVVLWVVSPPRALETVPAAKEMVA